MQHMLYHNHIQGLLEKERRSSRPLILLGDSGEANSEGHQLRVTTGRHQNHRLRRTKHSKKSRSYIITHPQPSKTHRKGGYFQGEDEDEGEEKEEGEGKDEDEESHILTDFSACM